MNYCDNKGELLHARCTLSNVKQYKDLKWYRCHNYYHYYQAQSKRNRLLVVLDLFTPSKQRFYRDASVTRYTVSQVKYTSVYTEFRGGVVQDDAQVSCCCPFHFGFSFTYGLLGTDISLVDLQPDVNQIFVPV